MKTFKTPKWESNESSDKNYTNLFENKVSKIEGKKSKLSPKNVVNSKKKLKKKISNQSKLKEFNTIKNNKKMVENKKNKIENKKKKIENKEKKIIETPQRKTLKTSKQSKLKLNRNRKTQISEPMTKLTQSAVPKVPKQINSKPNGSRATQTSKPTSGSTSNEYHTLLKSRKEIMKMSLRERMIERLKSSRFRYLNQELYTSEGKDAKSYFQKDPKAFEAYHEGYRQQVNKWPINPLDVILKTIQKMSPDKVIVDMGCGDAKLAQSVSQKVYSYDLKAVNDFVTECEMSNVPLEKKTADVVVFCLSLMGTNIKDFVHEANRILKIGGILKIAEVQSRFESVDVFVKGVEQFGFKLVRKDLSRGLFYFFDFKKASDCKVKNKLPTIGLLPCLYKKR